MSKKHSQSQKKKKHFSTKHMIAYFFVYTLIILMILALINFMIFPLMYYFHLAWISIVLGAIAAFFHIRRGTKDGVDDIANKIAR